LQSMMITDSFSMRLFLAHTPLFSAMSNAELNSVAQASQVRHFQRGHMVFRVGDPCQAVHIVASGRVKLFVMSTAGQEKVIEIVSPGESFAEAAVFQEEPSRLSAQVLSYTVVVDIGKHALVNAIERVPNFAMHILADISRKQQSLIRDVEAAALHSGTRRLIDFLLRDVPHSLDRLPRSFTVSLPASKATVASRLSLTPEYFSRMLHELAAAKLIHIDRRHIHVLDAQKLSRYAD
jgi:CRP-like cAMP-binding protein